MAAPQQSLIPIKRDINSIKNIITTQKNIFNSSTINTGYYLHPENGSLVANAEYDTSDYIPVQAGFVYSISKCDL
jgi:hypothetical protein